jgi:hypothetical protein
VADYVEVTRAAAKSAESVLELAGGECERLGLAEGDLLRELAV